MRAICLQGTRVSTQRFGVMIVLLLISGYIATDIYLPSLPAIAVTYHTTKALAQTSLSVFLLGFAVSQLVFGILSDRFGRRPMLLVGITIYIVASLVLVLSRSIDVLITFRLVQGLGIGAAAVMARALSRDVFSGDSLIRLFSTMAIFITLAPAVAPAIGGYLQAHFGVFGTMSAMLLYGVAMLVMVYGLLPETNQNKHPQALHPTLLWYKYKFLAKHPTFLYDALTAGIAFSVVIAYAAFSPFYLQDQLGLSAQTFGNFVFIMAFGLVAGMLVNRYFGQKIGPRNAIKLGLSIIAVATVIMLSLYAAGLLTLWTYVATVFITNMGVAVIIPNAAVRAFDPFAGILGLVASTYGFLQILVSSGATLVVSLLHAQTVLPVALVVLGLVSIGTVLQVRASVY